MKKEFSPLTDFSLTEKTDTKKLSNFVEFWQMASFFIILSFIIKNRSFDKLQTITIIYFPDDNKYWIFNLTGSSFDFVQVSFFFFAVKFVMSKVESPES